MTHTNIIQLRDYQSSLEFSTGQALRRYRRVLLQCPPGGGKTAIATSMASKFAAREKNVWFICHRAELIEGTSKTFQKYGLAHGYIAAGLPMSLSLMVQICSIDTLKSRLDKLKAPRLAIVDEAHHCGAAGWALVVKWLVDNGAQVIGLSGTPRRHDGTGLDEQFDDMILGPAVSCLIEQGHLSQYTIFAPSAPDMRGVGKLAGDFKKSESAERMDKPKLTGDMIAHWKERAKGLITVGFGVTIAHSQHLAAEFCAAGIRAVHLDGGTKKNERRAMIADVGDGGIEIIFNVGLFGEGFDLASMAQRDISIGAIIDAAPTMSLPWHLQKVMRPMRPGVNKTAIILDHAGNTMRHGFPDDEHDWSLEGTKGAKRAANDNTPPPPITCEGCYIQIRRPCPPCCPSCGKLLKAEARRIEVEEGKLVEMTSADKRAIREKLRQEQIDAKSIGELAALGASRGYSNPQVWAMKVWGGRPKNMRIKELEK